MRDEELFDEGRLRRALRLESAELPPRLDLAAITARAEAARSGLTLATLASRLLAGVAATALVALAIVALPSLAPAVAADVLAAALAMFATVSAPARGVLAVAQEPSVPIAALGALALAIAYEYAQRRERAHGVASS